MKKVKFGTLVPGDLFLYNDKLYVVTLESWIQDAYNTMDKINCALIKMKPNDGLIIEKSIYLEPNCEVRKLNLHELNTIIEELKLCLTFSDLEIGDKFHFTYKTQIYVKINEIKAVSLSEGSIKSIYEKANVVKI